MNFDELIDFLEKRLQKEMPGDVAHDLMKPTMANGAPLRLSHPVPPKEGGVLILLYEEEGRTRFPLIQRPSYEGIHSGQMALPGGKKEIQDKDLIMTARRETREEIGISENHVEVVGTLSKFYVAASNYNVLPVIGKMAHIPSFDPDPREVDDIITPEISQLINPELLKSKDMEVRNGYKLHCPYFELEGRTVWGATAMMLSELMVILREFHHS